ncbi:Trmt1, partial [Symbiodinium microadriaticum]
MLMYQHRDPGTQFDVIDLDPYGSASPFLDPAVQAVADGGLLCVTCTDMPVLSGNYPETCFSKYGSLSLKSNYHAEMALRILLHSIDTAANRYKKYVVPWVSVAVDFYVRLFVRVYQSPAEVKRSCTRRCHIYQSTQCPNFYRQSMATQELRDGRKADDHNVTFTNESLSVPAVCEETGGRLKIGGPFWAAPIHDMTVVQELLRRVEEGDCPFPVPTKPRLGGLLTAISEELPDVPFFYNLSTLCAAANQRTVPMNEFKAALINAGYRVSNFHKDPLAIKTDAPNSVLWDIIRAYHKQFPCEPPSKKKKQSRASVMILEKEPSIEVDFTLPKELSGEKKKALRFPPNP